MSGIEIDKCESCTHKLILLFESKAPDDQLKTSTMDVLKFLWDQSNLLYDLVQNKPKDQGLPAQYYADGVKLGELAYQVALKLREYGVKDVEEIALRIRLKAILQVQGHYHDVIGPAMLEHSALLCELGRIDEASGNYDCVIDDFSWLLDEYRNTRGDVGHEDLISLNALLSALNKRLEIGQLSQDAVVQIGDKIRGVERILALRNDRSSHDEVGLTAPRHKGSGAD